MGSCHLWIRDSFTSSFPNWVPFISFSCLIALIRISSTMLNSCCESRHPSLVLDHKGNTFSLTLLNVLAEGFSQTPFTMLRNFLSIPRFSESFYHERVFGFSQISLLHQLRWSIMCFFPSVLLIWCITLICFLMLNHSCIPRISPTHSWCIILLISCWIWFASILWRTVASKFIYDIGL